MFYGCGMGSFTEVSLSFDFVESTPAHVLAAFSALATPVQPVSAPALPTPIVVDPSDPGHWEPDFLAAENGTYDQPWLQPWATFVSMSMGYSTTPHGLLVRTEDNERWNLDCRFSWKILPWLASDTLAWLAPYVYMAWHDRVLVGTAVWENLRPILFWVVNGEWEMEDLNPEDEQDHRR